MVRGIRVKTSLPSEHGCELVTPRQAQRSSDGATTDVPNPEEQRLRINVAVSWLVFYLGDLN